MSNDEHEPPFSEIMTQVKERKYIKQQFKKICLISFFGVMCPKIFPQTIRESVVLIFFRGM